MSTWYRIEGHIRSAAMTGGVEARVADPLWMLARQWQVGEFIADDAGTPLAATVEYETTSISRLRLGPDGDAAAYDPTVPLERTVEAGEPAHTGGARLSHGSAAANSLMRLLRNRGASDAIDRLRERFPLEAGDGVTLGARGDAVERLLARRSFDGIAAAALEPSQLAKLLGDEVDADTRDLVKGWQVDVRARFGEGDGAWRSDRMEHEFAIECPTPGRPIHLRADGYTGGRLDWYSFDVAPESESHQPLADEIESFTTLPTPVRYDGMPASRWWEFEDASVQFGDLDAGPTDLARMIVADFATVYGDDWYVVPLSLPHGSLTRVRGIRILDTFGEETLCGSIVAGDERPALGRAWSMFELFGDTSVEKGGAPLLFLPPVLSASLHGPVTERVDFARDEGANLGWAIEHTVEGALGRPVDRRDAWLASRPPTDPAASDDLSDGRYEEQVWKYRLESPAPPFWIPLVPERITDDRPDIHFRRGRLQSWEQLDPDIAVGVKGETLEPDRPLIIREEEIPRSGISVQRRWQYARWIDGSTHVWVQRRRRQGRGERSSGLEWDRLDRGNRPA